MNEEMQEYLEWVTALQEEEQWHPVEWFDLYSEHASSVLEDFSYWQRDRIAWLLFNSTSK